MNQLTNLNNNQMNPSLLAVKEEQDNNNQANNSNSDMKSIEHSTDILEKG